MVDYQLMRVKSAVCRQARLNHRLNRRNRLNWQNRLNGHHARTSDSGNAAWAGGWYGPRPIAGAGGHRRGPIPGAAADDDVVASRGAVIVVAAAAVVVGVAGVAAGALAARGAGVVAVAANRALTTEGA